jgi:Putative lactococcus lactis phage r1t holin
MTSGFEWDPARPGGNGWVEKDHDVEPETTLLAAAGPADILAAGGILRAPEVVELAAAAGLDLAAAAVVLIKESGGGRNVWGHDNVPTGGAYVKGAPVTEQAYQAYLAAVNAGRAGRNGCGPMQLTWSGYQQQADQLGGCWDWRCNVTVGFQALAQHIRNSGMRGGFRDYNGSGPAAEAYADNAMAQYLVWATRLGTPEPEDDMACSVWDRREGPWAGGISNIPDPVNGEEYDLFEYVKRNNVTTYQTALMVQELRDRPQVKQQLNVDVDRLATRLSAHPAIQSLVGGDLGTVSFWKGAGERALKSFAGFAVTLFGAGPLDVLHTDWEHVLGLSAGAAVVSLLMSLASAQVGTAGSPSLVKEGNS